MKEFFLNDNKYIVQDNYKDCFNIDETKSLFTDYFNEFDYILGDYSYNRLRLKGFLDTNNKKVKGYNDISNYKKYIKNFCADDCAYFLLKKIK